MGIILGCKLSDSEGEKMDTVFRKAGPAINKGSNTSLPCDRIVTGLLLAFICFYFSLIFFSKYQYGEKKI